ICRPHGLRAPDVARLMDEAVATIGWRYDLRNVLDLARYLIPVRIVPERLRTEALHFGSGEPPEVICSSLIARLFSHVRFPILPTQVLAPPEPQEGDVAASGAREPHGRALVRRIFGHPSRREYTGLFRM